jgi:hypothetical protein
MLRLAPYTRAWRDAFVRLQARAHARPPLHKQAETH